MPRRTPDSNPLAVLSLEAKALKRTFADLGQAIPLSTIQEALARRAGFANLNAMAASRSPAKLASPPHVPSLTPVRELTIRDDAHDRLWSINLLSTGENLTVEVSAPGQTTRHFGLNVHEGEPQLITWDSIGEVSTIIRLDRSLVMQPDSSHLEAPTDPTTGSGGTDFAERNQS